MLNSIINFSVHNKLLILLGTLSLILYGSYQFTLLPIDAVPDITDNQVQVITSSPSLGAPDVERLISFPIEQANSNIPGLKQIRSFSRFGLSVVTIVFHDNVDVYWARQQVNERLQQVQKDIPEGLGSPTLAPVTTGLGEIYQYVIRPKKGFEDRFSSVELRTIQDWIVRRQLIGVPGVADVSSFGGKLKQYQVLVNTDRLKSYNLTIKDVFSALENNNQNTGGSFIEKGPVVLFIRSEGLVEKIADIENIVVKNTASGVPVKISDIGKVEIGSATRYGAVCYNDEGEVAGAVLMMLKGENSSAVIKRVKKKIEEIEKMLPEGVEIEPFLDRTKMVNNAIGTVEKNLMEGALIVIFILVMFLGNLRAGLVVASVIPLSMLFAVILMNIFGVSGNLMSLGALDFGLIVDGAVIIVEAVMHQLSHQYHKTEPRYSQLEMDVVVKGSSSKMMSAAVFGQIIILIVYLPIFTLEGIEGKMFMPMAQTVTFALLGAFVLSLTYIPVMTALALSKKVKKDLSLSDKAMIKIENSYQRTLNGILKHPKVTVGVAVVLLFLCIVVMSFLGGEFIPELEEGDFAVDTRVLPGSNLQTTVKSTQQVAHILLSRFPEVQKVVTKIGSGEIPTDPMPIEASDMMVILKDKHEWTSAKTFDELAEKMSKAIEDVPGTTAGFQYPVQMRFNELMTGARQDVVCKVFGENLDSLASVAAKMGEVINTVDGAKDLYVETVTGMPQIVVKYNRPLLAQYGMNIKDINQVLNTAFAGAASGLVFEEEKRFDLVVKLDQNQRSSLADVQNLLIATPQGAQLPLSHFATVDIVEGPAQIQRENAQRRITVGFNVRGKDVQTVVKELEEKVKNQIKLPAGYFITYGGSFENLQAAKQRLGIAVPLSLLLIFLLLYFAFNSIKHGLLIFSAIPLSAIGGIFALAMRGMPFSISAGIGFIALFGVAVLNGIVLISEFNRLKITEQFQTVKEIVIVGTRTRLRPVLMTACVASLGFLPMAFSDGAGAEVQRPLATVVIGGLFTATLLTLFVLPVLYIWFEKKVIKPNVPPAAVVVILLLFGFSGLNAQQSVSLSDAINMAVKNNPTLQPVRLQKEYYKALIPTAKDLPKTDFNAELGQINSIKFDYKLSAAQSFSLPKVYKTQAEVYKAQSVSKDKELAVKQQEIAARVTSIYGEILNFSEVEKVLQWADSVYSEFLTHAEMRLRLGESNLAEKINAEMQRNEIKAQMNALRSDREMLIKEFNRLLNTQEMLVPQASSLSEFAVGIFNENPPAAEQKQSEILVKKAEIEAEKAKNSPDFQVGISTQSITGYQLINGQDKYVQPIPRFFTIQAGISVPLFQKAAKAKIQAAELNARIADAERVAIQYEWQQSYLKSLDNYQKKLSLSKQYAQNALPNVQKMLQLANFQIEKGEINFMEWTFLVNQGIEIKSRYAQMLQEVNTALFDLQYFYVGK